MKFENIITDVIFDQDAKTIRLSGRIKRVGGMKNERRYSKR